MAADGIAEPAAAEEATEEEATADPTADSTLGAPLAAAEAADPVPPGYTEFDVERWHPEDHSSRRSDSTRSGATSWSPRMPMMPHMGPMPSP